MVIDFVKDGHAWFKCDQCGAETTILKWDFDHVRGFEVINSLRSANNIASFTTIHKLCKPATIQAEMFNPLPDESNR